MNRRITKDKNATDTNDDRYLHWYWHDDGYLVIAGRFPPEEGAIFIEALTATGAAQAGDAEKDQPAARDSAESLRRAPDGEPDVPPTAEAVHIAESGTGTMAVTVVLAAVSRPEEKSRPSFPVGRRARHDPLLQIPASATLSSVAWGSRRAP